MIVHELGTNRPVVFGSNVAGLFFSCGSWRFVPRRGLICACRNMRKKKASCLGLVKLLLGLSIIGPITWKLGFWLRRVDSSESWVLSLRYVPMFSRGNTLFRCLRDDYSLKTKKLGRGPWGPPPFLAPLLLVQGRECAKSQACKWTCCITADIFRCFPPVKGDMPGGRVFYKCVKTKGLMTFLSHEFLKRRREFRSSSSPLEKSHWLYAFRWILVRNDQKVQ